MLLSYVLDLIGVFAFGSYGAFRALQARMNVFGVFVCAGMVAMGGGTVRELILHGTPTLGDPCPDQMLSGGQPGDSRKMIRQPKDASDGCGEQDCAASAAVSPGVARLVELFAGSRWASIAASKKSLTIVPAPEMSRSAFSRCN